MEGYVPLRVPFEELEWADDAPGIRAREAEVSGARWATVEYAEGAGGADWCEEGHRGYVISGEIEYEFDDGREPLRASQGEAFLLPPAATHLREAKERQGPLRKVLPHQATQKP